MSDTETTAYMPQSRLLLGRKQIFSPVEEITAANILDVLDDAYIKHTANADAIEYLYKYYKGAQEVQNRTKVNHEDLCAKITENVAAEIKDFWSGYICGEPIQYVSTDGKETVAINKLNTLCYGCSKSAVDKEIIDWALLCGVGYRLVTQNPTEMFALDPRRAFVIYKDSYTKEPLAGVVYDKCEDENYQDTRHFNVYTKDKFFEIKDHAVVAEKPNYLGITIVEYVNNTARQGCFERVLPLLDAINDLQSNRLDGVAQQIQSLLALFNADLPEDTTATDIRELGILQLVSRDGLKGDIKEIATNLDQTAVQVYKKDLYEAALRISGVPATSNGNTGDSSNNGAVILKNGWQGAEARAKDFELLFKRSERATLRILEKICSVDSSLGFDFDPNTIDPHFTRRCYEDISTKATVLNLLLGTNKVAPELCFKVCGLFTDPESAYAQSKKYAEEMEKRTKAEQVVANPVAQQPTTAQDGSQATETEGENK